ncbi:MAG: hypothetical protein ACE5FT_02745 [Candidatus Nanoarchaeia archaeon]
MEKKAKKDHHLHESRSHKDIWKKDEPESKPKKSEWTKWVVRTLGLLGLLLVLMAALAFFVMFKVNAAQVTLNVVNLRNPALATVTKSGLVSLTDEKMRALDNPVISEHWGTLLECLDAGCEDSKFFGMVYVLALEENVPHKKLITDLIVTQRYWGTEEGILVFSKAVSDVDRGVAGLQSSKVKSGWQAVVDCDGVCEEKNDLYFNLFKQIIKVPA